MTQISLSQAVLLSLEPGLCMECSPQSLMLGLRSGQTSTGCLKRLPTWQVCICCPLLHQCHCEWWWHWQAGLECLGSRWAGAALALGWAHWKRRRWSAEDCCQWASKPGRAQSLQLSWAWRKNRAAFNYMAAGRGKLALRTGRLQQAEAHIQEQTSWKAQREPQYTHTWEWHRAHPRRDQHSDALKRTDSSKHRQKPATPCSTDANCITCIAMAPTHPQCVRNPPLTSTVKHFVNYVPCTFTEVSIIYINHLQYRHFFDHIFKSNCSTLKSYMIRGCLWDQNISFSHHKGNLHSPGFSCTSYFSPS